ISRSIDRDRGQATGLAAERIRARAIPLRRGTDPGFGAVRWARGPRASSRAEIRKSRTAFRSELAISGRGFVCIWVVVGGRQGKDEDSPRGTMPRGRGSVGSFGPIDAGRGRTGRDRLRESRGAGQVSPGSPRQGRGRGEPLAKSGCRVGGVWAL